ncbi:long-chain fatty acid transporter [Brevundimonas sp. GN22]|uniref:OmpP1/FadL family transporter n=1 Tax=Brevundimonas pishanensis TaxID=2896315 RepID=UPI001FA6D034|nr:outer membrane protein transport protein [Brevundimonas pishanensis]
MTSRNVARIGGLAILMASVAAPAFAGSFYLQEQSARGAGRAYSGEAADTGVQSLWWNPAAIARSGREATLSLHAIRLDSEARNTGSSLTLINPANGQVAGRLPVIDPRNTEVNPVESGLVPNFAVAMPINDRLSVGVAVAAPYNFTTKYEPGSFARYDAQTSELRSADLGVTVAYQVNDWLDIGAGVSAQYVKAKLTSAIPSLTGNQLAPIMALDGQSSLEGDGIDFGWNVGAQVHKGKWDLGLSYRSAIEHELDGDIVQAMEGALKPRSFATTGTASFNTPWFVSASVRYAATDKLTLNAQINQIGWSEFDAINVNFTGGGDVIHQNYEDVTTGAIGLDYAYSDKTTFRAGIGYDPTPTTDALRTARIPDSDRMLYSVGVSTEITDGIGFDAGITYIDMDKAVMNDDRALLQGAVISNLRGELEGSALAFSMGTTIKF